MKRLFSNLAVVLLLVPALTFLISSPVSAQSTTAAHHMVATAAAFSESCPATQAQGSSGDSVKVIQFRLNDLNEFGEVGHSHGNPFPLATDGFFGSLTQEAVLDFQSSNGLRADGIVSNQTWGTMGFCTVPTLQYVPCCASGSTSHFPPTIEEGSTGDFVAALQRGLNVDADGGFIPTSYNGTTWFPLTIDGSFGPNTKAAVQTLQKAEGITQDGVVGQNTWGKFGMDY